MELRDWRRWLQPGMSVKRWFALLAAGVILASLGLAMGLAWTYRHFDFPDTITGLVRNITLQFIPHPYREAILITIGACAIVLGFMRLSRSVIKPLMDLIDSDLPLFDLLKKSRYAEGEEARIHVVSIGGGTGLSTLLRGLKTRSEFDITAIVTVADDGGSTGRIRRDFEIPAPGDIRNCIVALAEDESTVARLFDYRFDRDGSELKGHSFGNLFITALTQVTGSFEEAVIESAKVLAVRGRVFPSTLESVDLCARMEDGRLLCGESTIGHSGGRIDELYLQPVAGTPEDKIEVYQPAIDAIRNADLIVLGPGSLYTSVIPNLLFKEIADAVRASDAPIVYVCNVATQHGETDHFGAADHIREVVKYLGEGVVSYALVNNNRAVESAIKTGVPVEAVIDEGLDGVPGDMVVLARDVVSDSNPLRHDPAKLADALFEIAMQPERTGEWTPSSAQPRPLTAAER